MYIVHIRMRALCIHIFYMLDGIYTRDLIILNVLKYVQNAKHLKCYLFLVSTFK